MKIYVDFEGIIRLFRGAQSESRDFLFEYEVYELIRLIGSETVPRYFLLPRGARNAVNLREIPWPHSHPGESRGPEKPEKTGFRLPPE